MIHFPQLRAKIKYIQIKEWPMNDGWTINRFQHRFVDTKKKIAIYKKVYIE